MKTVFLIFSMVLLSIGVSCQTTGKFKVNVVIEKSAPSLHLNGTNGVINFYNGDVTLTQSSNLLTLAGGNISLGANSLLGTGSIGATGSGKLAKGWFTNLEITNLPTINGTSIFANPVFTGGITTPAITLGSTLLTSTAAELNIMHGILVNTANINSLFGVRSNVQSQLDTKLSAYNSTFTGLTIVERLQVGTSTNAIEIQGLTDSGQGLTVTKDGAPITYNFPAENIININDIAVMRAELSGSLTDGSPTDAQIDVIVGTTPALKGAGYKVTIKDTDGTGRLYFIESDGTDWYWVVFTKAL